MRWIAGCVCGVVLLGGCGGSQQTTVSSTGPASFADVAVVNQLQLDSALHGHNMAVSGCFAYVTMQNGASPSKLAEVNLCGAGTAYGASPALVGAVAGSYPGMNGITANGSQLYVTYSWATNPFEVWTVGSGSALPTVTGCVPLFTVPQAATCGANVSGAGALYGGNPYVIGSDAYVGENSDDAGQAVQVVNVAVAQAPVKVNAAPLGITAGVSTGGATLAGLWVVGSGNTLYVGTVDDVASASEPVTIAQYDASVNPVTPTLLETPLSMPEGYALQGMAVSGATVVATLYNATTQAWEIAVAEFPVVSAGFGGGTIGGAGSPGYVTLTPASGCGFKVQNFVAIEGSYAFVGCGTGSGIEVLDLSAAGAPKVMGVIGASLNGVGFISAQGRYIYAVDADGKLDTLDVGTVFQ